MQNKKEEERMKPKIHKVISVTYQNGKHYNLEYDDDESMFAKLIELSQDQSIKHLYWFNYCPIGKINNQSQIMKHLELKIRERLERKR